MKTSSEISRFIRMAASARFLIPAIVLAMQATWISAQEKEEPSPPTGFIRIANAIAPGTGNVKVLIDGKNVYAPGYKFGAVTGGIGLPPGGHSVTIRREGVEEGTTRVSIDKGQTITLIPYAESVPATDQEKAHFEIRILRLKQKEIQDGRGASFVSVSGQPEIVAEIRDPAGKWEKVHVKRLSIGEAVIRYPEGYVPIRVNRKDVEPIPIGDAGNYVVVLYDDPEGNLKSLNFRDFKYLSAD
jgi:hypothetical protein